MRASIAATRRTHSKFQILNSKFVMRRIDGGLIERLYRKANAERWRVPVGLFAEALETSAHRVSATRS